MAQSQGVLTRKKRLAPWRILGVGLCGALLLFAIASNVMEAQSVFFAPAKVGDIGARFAREAGAAPAQIILKDLKPNSPLKALGFHEGEAVRFDHSWDDLRTLRAGETVGLTQSASRQRFEIIVPPATPATLSHRVANNLNFLANFPVLLVSLFMLWRSRGDIGIIALAMAFACNAAASPYRWPTSSAEYPVWNVVLNAGFALIPWFLLQFSMRPYENTGRKITPRQNLAYGILISLQLITFTLNTGSTVFNIVSKVNFELLNNILQGFGFAIAFFYLISGFKRGNAETRKRYAMLMVAFAGTFLPDIVFIVTAHISNLFRFGSSSSLALTSWISQILGALLFAYAIFRHKVLDVGFAINRTLVYATVSVFLLAAFGLVEWAVEHLIHFEEREQNAFLDAGIALGIYLSFHRVRSVVEHFIAALFFRQWHINEAAMRQFINEARFIGRRQALNASFARELTRFCGGARCALYEVGKRDDYAVVTGELRGTSKRIDTDDPIVVKLRAYHKPLELDVLDAPAGAALALPMIHRNHLLGFVLVAPKPSGEGYRPDELDLLGEAATRIGADLYALNMEVLETDVAKLRRENTLLEVKYDELQKNLHALTAA